MALALASTLFLTSVCFLGELCEEFLYPMRAWVLCMRVPTCCYYACYVFIAGPRRALAQDQQEPCQSIVTDCSPLGDCSGVTCALDTRTVGFSVKRCTDPLEIDVWVNDTGSSFFDTFTSDREVNNGVNNVTLTSMRDDSRDVVNVEVSTKRQHRRMHGHTRAGLRRFVYVGSIYAPV